MGKTFWLYKTQYDEVRNKIKSYYFISWYTPGSIF